MIRSLILSAVCAMSLTPAYAEESYPDAKAIVSIGGPVTEILFALGAGERVVARDTTAQFPAAVMELPDVGYMRRLSAEGVLSVGPDLIIARHTSGPPETLDLLRAASVPVVLVQDAFTGEAVSAAIRKVGSAIGEGKKAETLATEVEADLNQLAVDIADVAEKKRVMFILSNDGGRLNVAGRDTGAHGIITLAGGDNMMGPAFSGYKLLNDEAIIKAQPELILMMTGRGDHEGRAEEILALPAIASTPAGVNGAFQVIPGAALGFGPRTAAFARSLHDIIYDEKPVRH
ncbi:heme/hemin ABC transporter substrate-binding protein [Thalassobius sp. MITS945101]|uniref:heme/hemin ABC transporter substrate-binding protein n=1 Tax=Thalassobius sp. MITS945101 TaxID=3096994 RepID=UPI00399BF86F